MKKKGISTAADSVRSGWPLWNRLWSRHPIEARSLRAQAQLIQSETKTLTIEKKAEKETEVREQARSRRHIMEIQL
ncbi:hypothetical protein TNCV_3337461 [Trichonephila clavipes]|nr:hypothetical protein TNCV_3337461 [Trichonephila clavipes]